MQRPNASYSSPPACRGVLAVASVVVLGACSELADPAAPLDFANLAAVTSAAAFTESFDVLDESVWSRSAHTLGRGPLRPELASVAGGLLRLETRQAGYEGSEVRTWETFGAGTFSARGRCAAPAGTLCTLFMYELGVGDRADEIDIEILSGTREIWFTTWVGGRRMNHVEKVLPFDPAAGFHTYTIERTSKYVRFLVDGVVMHTYSAGRAKIPQSAMPLFLNSWWPVWLAPAAADGVWEVDEVSIG